MFNIGQFIQENPEHADTDPQELTRKVYNSNPELQAGGVGYEEFAEQAGLGEHVAATRSGIVDAARAFGSGLMTLPGQVKANIASIVDPTVHAVDETTAAGRLRAESRSEIEAYKKKRHVNPYDSFLGLTSDHVVDAMSQLGYGVTVAAVGGASALASIPVPVPGATTAIPMVAMGGATFNMAKSQIVTEVRDAANYDRAEKGLPPFTEAEWLPFAENVNSATTKHALIEAVTEGVGNMVGFKLITGRMGGKIFKMLAENKVTRGIFRGAATMTEEQAQEIAAGKLQNPIEVLLGLSEPKTTMEVAKEVAPVTAITTGIMGGGAIAVDRTYRALKPAVSLEPISQDQSTDFMEEQKAPEQAIPTGTPPGVQADPLFQQRDQTQQAINLIDPMKDVERAIDLEEEADARAVEQEAADMEYEIKRQQQAKAERQAELQEEAKRKEAIFTTPEGVPDLRGLPQEDVYQPEIEPEIEPEPLVDLSQMGELDVEANEAASSPLNERPEPTDKQIEANNAKLGHVEVDGLKISIENPQGSVRTDKQNDPPQWQQEMTAHYGYLPSVLGADKDYLDIFVKPGTETSPKVFIVDQVDEKGNFDELKVILGADTQEEAAKLYQSNYAENWNGGAGITEMSMDEFKKWAFDGKRKTKPVSEMPWAEKAEVVHEMPDGTIMEGPEHEGAVEGSERVVDEGVSVPETEIVQPEADLEVEAEEKAKEPWEMTRDESSVKIVGATKEQIDNYSPLNSIKQVIEGRKKHWVTTSMSGVDFPTKHKTKKDAQSKAFDHKKKINTKLIDEYNRHKEEVQHAIQQGKPVPESVLKDYPDLQKAEPKEKVEKPGKLVKGKVLPKQEPKVLKQPTVEDNKDLAKLGSMERFAEIKKRFPDLSVSEHLKLSRNIQEAETGQVGADIKGERIGLPKEWEKKGGSKIIAVDKSGDIEYEFRVGRINVTDAPQLTHQVQMRKAGSSNEWESSMTGMSVSKDAALRKFAEKYPGAFHTSLEKLEISDPGLQKHIDKEKIVRAKKTETTTKEAAEKKKGDDEILKNLQRMRGNEPQIVEALKKAKAKKQKLDILATDGSVSRAGVPVMAMGDYAYHKDVKGDNYVVAHISSTMAVQGELTSKDARELAYRASLINEKWDGKGKPSKKFKDALKQTVQDLRDRNPIDLPKKAAKEPDVPSVQTDIEAVSREAVLSTPTRNYQEYWDNKIKLGRKVSLVSDSGWVTKKGKLSKLGEKISESKWEDLSSAAQNILSPKIDSLYQVATKKPEQKETDKIEDFGEKIGGARKDYYAEYSDKMTAAKDMDIASVPLSKAWPEPNYEKLIEDGVDPWVVAFVRSARDEIPAKPRQSWKLRTWTNQVEMLRGFADDLINDKITKEQIKTKLDEKDRSALRTGVGGRADLYLAVGHDKSLKGVTFEKHHWSLYKGEKNVTKWQVGKSRKATLFSNMPTILAEGNTKEETLENFKKNYATFDTVKKSKGVRFNMYSKHGEKGTYIGKKIGRNYIDLEKFDSTKEAREYLKANQEKLEEKLKQYKTIPDERRAVNRERIGKDHRNGKDVTPEMFNEALGFRGVEFGNWVNDKERQDNLNRAYDALIDLSVILDIPAKAISLNGELGIGFGSRGHGGKQAPSAHYEPGKIVINLTKKNGPGSLAHEWFHALDNYFSRKRGVKHEYITDRPRKTQDDSIREELLKAFNGLIKTVDSTGMKKRSEELDKRRTKPYWSTRIEMTARAFESYVIEKLSERTNVNDYLANIVSSGEYSQDMLEGLLSGSLTATDMYPYLLDSEIDSVSSAFNNLFEVMESRETDKGVELYSTKISDSGLTLKDAQSLFKGQSVGLNSDGDIWVKTTGGHALVITEVNEIASDEAEFKIAYGKVRGAGEKIAGSYQGFEFESGEHKGIIKIVKGIGDKFTLAHESTHFIEEAGLLNNLELNVLKNAYIKKHGPTKLGDKEKRATFIAEELENRENYRGTPVGRVLQKIADFIDSLVNLFKRTARGITKDVESGKVFDSKTSPVFDFAVSPSYSLAQAIKSILDNPKFGKWFGKSKVVDENGEPLVVYHGTVAIFDRFKKRRNDIGIHFGTEGQAIDRISYLGDRDRPTEGQNLMPVYLTIKNPLRLDDAGWWDAENLEYELKTHRLREYFSEAEVDRAMSASHPATKLKNIRDLIQQKGFDGIVYTNTGEVKGLNEYIRRRDKAFDKILKKFPSRVSAEEQKTPEYKEYQTREKEYQGHIKANAEDSYIAFFPTQIKSIYNRGTFSPTEPNIMYQKKSIRRDAPFLKLPVDSGGIDPEFLTDLTKKEPFLSKGFSGLDIPTKRTVLDGVRTSALNAEIRDAVIELIPVGVVNDFIRGEASPDMLLHNESMLFDILTVDSNGTMPISSDIADSLIKRVAFLTTKLNLTKPGQGFFKDLSALLAGDVDSVSGIYPGTSIRAEKRGGFLEFISVPDDTFSADVTKDSVLHASIASSIGHDVTPFAVKRFIENINSLPQRGINSKKEKQILFSLPITPEMKSKALREGMPLYQVKKPDIIDQKFGKSVKTWDEKVTDSIQSIKVKEKRDELLDKAITKGLDKLRPIKTQLGDFPYQLHRMETGFMMPFGTFLEHGKLKWKEGVFTVETKNEGVLPFLRSLGKDWEKLLYWTAAKRAGVLEGEGRERWLDADARKKIFEWAGSPLDKKMIEASKKLQDFNSNILDVAVEAGLIDPVARKEWQSDFYVPFYRIFENELARDEFLTGPRLSNKHISAQIKKLKGADQKLGDPVENYLHNWLHLIHESIRNKARAAAFDASQEIGSEVIEEIEYKEGVSKYITNKMRQADNVLTFRREGKPVYFKVHDPDLFQALANVNVNKMDNVLINFMGKTKRWLSYGATFGPGFRIRNVLRDTLHTSIVEKDFKPFYDSFKGFIKSMREDQDWIEFMASGAGFGGSYVNDDPEAGARYVRRVMKAEGPKNIILNSPKRLLDFWDKIGAASENAARIMLMENKLAKGETQLGAAFAARDIMDFSMSGGSGAVQFLIRTIPFLNARMQGLYRMGRGYKSDKKAFMLKGGMLSVASIALWSLFKDDERYKEMEDWEKWTYYHFWLGETHYRIPKPFETGVVFSTLPETMANVMNGNEDTKHIADFMGYAARDVFSLDWPQAVKPLMEQWANKNTFTGRPIVGMGLQGLPAGQQADPWTSETMQVMGGAMNMSPKRAEALVRGYFSTFGMFLLGSTDIVTHYLFDFPENPEMIIDDIIGTGGFVRRDKPVRNTKYMRHFYETSDEINKLVRGMRHFQETGEHLKAASLIQKNVGKFKAKEEFSDVKRKLTAINKKIKSIYESDLKPEIKRERLDELTKERNEHVKTIYEKSVSWDKLSEKGVDAEFITNMESVKSVKKQIIDSKDDPRRVVQIAKEYKAERKLIPIMEATTRKMNKYRKTIKVIENSRFSEEKKRDMIALQRRKQEKLMRFFNKVYRSKAE